MLQKGTVELASADAGVGGYILHRDGVGVVAVDVFNGLTHVGFLNIRIPGGCVSADEQRQRFVELAGHFHRTVKAAAPALIDPGESVLYVFRQTCSYKSPVPLAKIPWRQE